MYDKKVLAFEKKLKGKAFTDNILVPSHDRGILCGALNTNWAATGSQDHGIRIYDTHSGLFIDELFSLHQGHSEWVTSIKFIPKSDTLVSAGMEGKICLWNLKNKSCQDLVGHTASVSKMLVDDREIMISAAYDCTLRLWKLGSEGQQSSNLHILMGPHRDPIIEICWSNSLLIAGDKKGTVSFWDINVAQPVLTKKFHEGPCGTINFFGHEETFLLASAGSRDGKIIFYDLRTSSPLYVCDLKEGGVNAIFGYGNIISALTSKKSLALIDIKKLQKIEKIPLHCMAVTGNNVGYVALMGMQDGSLLVFDLVNREEILVYNKHLIKNWKFIETCAINKKILCGGDNPSGLLLSF